MLKVLCPVKKIKLQIGSELLDVVSSFTKFILWAVDRGYSAKYIASTIMLGEGLVQSEIDYLVKIGYLNYCGKDYLVTAIGQEFLRLINLIDAFNKEDYFGKINLFTGKFSGDCQNIKTIRVESEQVREDYLNSGSTIQKIVNPLLLLNYNYDTSREYVLQTYKNEFQYLSPEQLSSLYVKCVGVRTVGENTFTYLEYALPKYPKWNVPIKADCVNILILKRTVDVFGCRYRTEFSNTIDGWCKKKPQITKAEILPKLKQKYQFSDMVCKKIISDYFFLLEFGKNTKVYVDESNGQYLKDLPDDYSADIQKIYQAEKLIIDIPTMPVKMLEREISIDSKSEQKISCTIFFTLEERKTYYQIVDFSDFVEM